MAIIYGTLTTCCVLMSYYFYLYLNVKTKQKQKTKKRERETRQYSVLNFPPEIKSSKFELNLICYKLKHFNLLLNYMLICQCFKN